MVKRLSKEEHKKYIEEHIRRREGIVFWDSEGFTKYYNDTNKLIPLEKDNEMKTNEMIEFLKSKSDPDKCIIDISYNPHLVIYKTVNDYINTCIPCELEDFINEEDKEKCIKENKMWLASFSFNRGLGTFSIAGSELDLVLQQLCEDVKRND